MMKPKPTGKKKPRETTFPQTLQEAIKYFADPDTCVAFMSLLRWPDGVTCPKCDGKAVSYLSTRRMWKCKNKECHKQFSVKVGTIMEDSPIGLDKWLMAIWMLANCKNGISSWELSRALDIQQRSAWFVLHRVRYAMQRGTFEKLSGTIEADETFVGGLSRNMHKKDRERKITGPGGCGKVIVFGMLERGGEARAEIIPDRSGETIQGEVRRHVEPGSELMTDAHKAYRALDGEYIHQYVDHGSDEYVRDDCHTNGMENFWTLFKRAIKGTYVAVNTEHLSAYVDEQSFRYNERHGNDAERFLEAVSGIGGKRLTYETLTTKKTGN
jgi:transposase-like protein